MDTAALEAFLAVARAESFSRAAEALHLTQPAVSKRIAGLESTLDVRLFDRVGRVVSLTEAGRALLPRARRVLEELADCERELQSLSGRVAGPLLLGTSHHIGLHRLPPVLRAFSGRHPEVRLDLRFMASESVIEAVAEGALELGIVTLPDTDEGLPLEMIPVWEDAMVVAISRDHPLAAGPWNPRRLETYPAILTDSGTYTRALVDRGLAAAGLQVHTNFTTNYLETIKMMVSVGLGWSVLPETMAGPELVSHPLVPMSRRLGVVRHRGRTLSNAARAMIGLLEERVDGSAAGPWGRARRLE